MVFCISCGTQSLVEGAKFCICCGEKLYIPDESPTKTTTSTTIQTPETEPTPSEQKTVENKVTRSNEHNTVSSTTSVQNSPFAIGLKKTEIPSKEKNDPTSDTKGTRKVQSDSIDLARRAKEELGQLNSANASQRRELPKGKKMFHCCRVFH
jgi:hypothetical protein